MNYAIAFLVCFALLLFIFVVIGAIKSGQTEDERMKKLQNGLIRRGMREPK